MHYFGYIELAGMYLRELNLRDVPAVVHDRGVLLDVSAGAAARGVLTGFSLAEAKAILRDKAVYAEYREDDFLAARDRWLGRILKYADAIEPASPSSAFVDLSGHPEPGEIAGMLLGDIYSAERLPIRCGLASAKWIARISAQRCDPVALGVGILPIEPVRDAKAWLAPQPVSVLEPLTEYQRRSLQRMGIKLVGELQALPDAVLAQQFKKNAALIRAVCEGRFPDPVCAAWPLESFVASVQMSGCESTLELDAALDEISLECARRLSASDKVAGAMHLYLAYESQRIEEFNRSFKRATQSRSELLGHLRQAVLGLRLDEPVESARVRLIDLARSPRKQMTFAYSDRRDVSGLEPTLDRLKDAFGTGVVIKGSEVRLSREMRVLKAWKDAYGWK